MNKSKVMNLGLTCKLVRDRSRFRNRKQNNSRQDQVGLGELAKIDNHKDIVYLVYDSAKWIILYFVSTYRHFFLSNIKCTLVCFLGLIHNVFSLVSGGDFSQVSVVIALHFQVEDFGLARGRLNALLYNCLLYNWRERPKFKQKKRLKKVKVNLPLGWDVCRASLKRRCRFLGVPFRPCFYIQEHKPKYHNLKIGPIRLH